MGAAGTSRGETPAPDIAVQGVGRAFGEVVALDGVDLTVRGGRRVGLVGRSGCGKSTLLSCIAGLIEPDAGRIAVGRVAGASDRLEHCALMPQRDVLLPWRTALDNACLALENRGLSRTQARAQARPLFERFGLAAFERAKPSELSGGMRQRVAFLRTLLAEKDVLLLDEPFSALDAITRAEMQEWLLGALGEEPRTVLLATHDVDEALLLAEHVAVLSPRPGRIVRILDIDLPRDAPRREVVTSPAFAALKEQALEALEW
jgi:NitT/TauT family transport system ATP-binding protein